MSLYADYDAALAQLAPCGPDLKNGLTSHMPMVVEALCRMGCGDMAAPWLHSRLTEAEPHPPATLHVHEGNWQGFLGKTDQFTPWRRFFEGEVEAMDLRDLLDKWVPRLAPGYAGAATHGLLRTAHAARAFADHDTPQRRDELAQGLALWASTYLPLPESAPDGIAPKAIDEALAAIPLVPLDERQNNGSIVMALIVLGGRAEFAPLIHTLDLGDDHRTTCLDLVEALGPIFLTQAVDPLSTIVFTHGITSLMASHFLCGQVSRQSGQKLIRYGWQAVAGLYACYADPSLDRHDPAPERTDEIIEQAIAHGDDHVIKLSEACINFDSQRPNPLFKAIPSLAREWL